MPYIYEIENLINHKLYIGKTSLPTIQQRFEQHIQDSKRLTCEKRPLYRAFNKYGITNFVIRELEYVQSDAEACEREIYWIDYKRTYIGFSDCNGYNATLGGDSKRYYNYREIANKYQELQSVKLTSEYFGCSIETVQKACRENNITINKYSWARKIKRVDSSGETKVYNTIIEAAKEIPNKEVETARKNISRALNKGGVGYGYKWYFI